MTIQLSQHESGRPYKGRYKKDLKALQERLYRIMAAHIVHGRRAVIMLEGWDCAGKDGIIARLVDGWSQAHYEVWPIGTPSAQEAAHHFLWRFRTRVPDPGQIAIFDRSWYGRVLVEKVEALTDPAALEASYGEINAFEAGLANDGVTLVKLFVHITQDEQDRRLRARIEDPWRRWKTGHNDFKNRSHRAGYLDAMAEMFARTDTAHAPWHVVDGNDKKAARIAALTIVADRLEAAVPMQPPTLDTDIAILARDVLGMDLAGVD